MAETASSAEILELRRHLKQREPEARRPLPAISGLVDSLSEHIDGWAAVPLWEEAEAELPRALNIAVLVYSLQLACLRDALSAACGARQQPISLGVLIEFLQAHLDVGVALLRTIAAATDGRADTLAREGR